MPKPKWTDNSFDSAPELSDCPAASGMVPGGVPVTIRGPVSLLERQMHTLAGTSAVAPWSLRHHLGRESVHLLDAVVERMEFPHEGHHLEGAIVQIEAKLISAVRMTSTACSQSGWARTAAPMPWGMAKPIAHSVAPTAANRPSWIITPLHRRLMRSFRATASAPHAAEGPVPGERRSARPADTALY